MTSAACKKAKVVITQFCDLAQKISNFSFSVVAKKPLPVKIGVKGSVQL